MRIIIFLYLFLGYFNISLKSQNGQYISDNYKFYYNVSENKSVEVRHKYILSVSISEFLGQGEIIIKDINEDIVLSSILTGKVKEDFDEKTNQKVIVYYSTLKVYDKTQPEMIILLIDASNNKLNCIVSKSIEFGSEGYYCNLTPLEETLSSTGSGFLISNDGYIITNYHVVQGAKQIVISSINGNYAEKYNATLIIYDKELDIALLKVNASGLSINYTINDKESEVGESVFVLGYPMISAMGSEIKLTDGLISSSSGYLNDKLYYQISSPIQPGNSGCPLFDANGNVIGLVTSKLTNGENVGYALKSKNIIEFIKLHHIVKPVSNVAQLQTSLAQKVKKLKPNIISIETIRQ